MQRLWAAAKEEIACTKISPPESRQRSFHPAFCVYEHQRETNCFFCSEAFDARAEEFKHFCVNLISGSEIILLFCLVEKQEDIRQAFLHSRINIGVNRDVVFLDLPEQPFLSRGCDSFVPIIFLCESPQENSHKKVFWLLFSGIASWTQRRLYVLCHLSFSCFLLETEPKTKHYELDESEVTAQGRLPSGGFPLLLRFPLCCQMSVASVSVEIIPALVWRIWHSCQSVLTLRPGNVRKVEASNLVV